MMWSMDKMNDQLFSIDFRFCWILLSIAATIWSVVDCIAMKIMDIRDKFFFCYHFFSTNEVKQVLRFLLFID